MRTYCISDLHLGADAEGDRCVDALARHVCREGGPDDTLVVVGDIAIDDLGIAECLRKFRGFRGTRCAVPGNHDVWVGRGEDSRDRYRRLSGIIAGEGFHPLEDGPVRRGGTAFVGSMGWYDYSFLDDGVGIPREACLTKVFPGEDRPCWGDAAYVRWPHSDEEVTQMMLDRLSRHLDEVGDASDIIVAIHHVPAKRLLVHPRFLVPRRWRFANAFLGSDRFSRLFAGHADRVRLVVNGHIHRRCTLRKDGIVYASIGGGYRTKELVVAEGAKLRRMSFAP